MVASPGSFRVSQDLICNLISIIKFDLLAGVSPLMDAKEVEGLRKMYDLLDRVDALEPLKLAFAKSVEVWLFLRDRHRPNHSQTTVSKIVLLSISEEEEMIPQLLAFKSFIDSLLTAAFRENAKVQYDMGVPAKQEIARGKQKDHPSSFQDPRPNQKRGKGPFGYAATDAFAKGFGKRQRKPAEMIGPSDFKTPVMQYTDDIHDVSQIY